MVVRKRTGFYLLNKRSIYQLNHLKAPKEINIHIIPLIKKKKKPTQPIFFNHFIITVSFFKKINLVLNTHNLYFIKIDLRFYTSQ
jgi:hypothetical protein